MQDKAVVAHQAMQELRARSGEKEQERPRVLDVCRHMSTRCLSSSRFRLPNLQSLVRVEPASRGFLSTLQSPVVVRSIGLSAVPS